jgi:Ser/Thr protein kinase RdoA (MazF antagonist)
VLPRAGPANRGRLGSPGTRHPAGGAPVIRELSAAAARGLAAGLLGTAVDEAEAVSASAEHQVFRVERRGLIAFLKLASGADVQRELAVLRLLDALGVPVPAVEAADHDGELAGMPCVLLRQAEGEPVRAGSPEFAAAGALLRRVHEVAAGGFGSVAAGQDGLHGEDRTWATAMSRRVAGLEPIAAAGLVDGNLLARAAAAVADRAGWFGGCQRGHLLHGDFHPRHVYARDGQITAIIDWADATCGDPVYDLARVLHSVATRHDLRRGFEIVDRVLGSYGGAPWLPADLTGPLLLYAVVFTLWSMKSEIAGGAPWPPWWPAQAAVLSALLDELDRVSAS